ncbi:hypothetical protein [Portibacter lacus]|nr:hypothetical protein [Portibacter lacus]
MEIDLNYFVLKYEVLWSQDLNDELSKGAWTLVREKQEACWYT